MSVIGSLDSQVNDLIIAPLEKRRAPDGEEAQATETPAAFDQEPYQHAPDEKREERDAIAPFPVWML